MTFPIPTPDEIADLQAGALEESLRIDRNGNTRFIDARSPRSVLAAISRSNALGLYGTHQHLRWIVDQLFVDTCDEAYLPRHGGIFGPSRRGAIAAVGNVIFTGPAGLPLAAGIALTVGGVQWLTSAAAAIGAGGTATVPVVAAVAGSAGNIGAGAHLALMSPIVTLPTQQVTVAEGGISGGADIESVESWRQRIIANIREPGYGGSTLDYIRWANDAIAPARVSVVNAWVGAGSVGVIFAMATAGIPRAPTPAEVATLDAALQAIAPVTAEVVTVGATLLPINITINVAPNQQSVLNSVTAAVTAYMASADIQIGQPLHRSRLSEAISAAVGEAWHTITLPVADVSPTAAQLPVLGNLTVAGTS
jgi:uncharacterized phage protein gp47/JayE